MPFLLENDTRRKIIYAGLNELRREFVEHVVGDDVSVIALGGGIELHALHPLTVAQAKITFAQQQQDESDACYVAFDALTAVPIGGEHGPAYQILGKPKDEDAVQRMFRCMNDVHPLPYRIRAASVLVCGAEQKSAWHDASIHIDPKSLSWLASDSGFARYAEYISIFGYQWSQTQHPTDYAAGLNLEALLAMNCVTAINDIEMHQQGFEVEAQRALFLAMVGASHKILGQLTHYDDPMKHIISFPHHLDSLALIKKYSGVI